MSLKDAFQSHKRREVEPIIGPDPTTDAEKPAPIEDIVETVYVRDLEETLRSLNENAAERVFAGTLIIRQG